MSEHSDKFNALPFEQRLLLSAMLVEEQIRLIEAEKIRLRIECANAIRGHNERIGRMRHHLKTTNPQATAQEGSS